MKHLLDVIKGAVFGIANIVPGVSGGTMAVVMKVFDKLIGIFSLDFKKIKENWKFIIFFGIGGAIGLAVAAFALKALFKTYYVPTQMFFTGVVVGSIPFIWKLTVKENKFRPINVVPLILGIVGIIALGFVQGGGSIPVDSPADIKLLVIMAVYLCIAAIAMIIPGLSGSMVLMILGGYPLALAAVTELNIKILAAMIIGAALGLVLGSRAIGFMLKKFYQGTYCIILGLIIGSVYMIFPWKEFSFNTQGIVGMVLLVVGLFVPLLMEVLGKNTGKEEA